MPMVGLYARVSTAEQAENGHSLEEQTDRMTKYCEALKWTVYDVYVDGGYSGAKMERPALKRLIADAKSQKIDRVLVYKLDRLSRSQKDTLTLIEDVFLRNHCDFVSMSENFDTSTPFGRAMIGILAVFAQLEREQIKERMSMGKEARAKSGKYAGSFINPIGYDYTDGKLVTNDFERMLVIQIFEDFVSGKTIKRIADDLNARGLHHKYGKWSASTVRGILTHKTYCGYVSFQKKWYKGNHEPFVDEALFDHVQDLIRAKTEKALKTNSRAWKATSYLGGLCWCARCGAKYGKIKTHYKEFAYFYYACNTRAGRGSPVAHRVCRNKNWNMNALDNLIFDEIRKLSFEEITPVPKDDDHAKLIQSKIDDLDGQIKRLMDLYSVGGVPLDLLHEKIQTVTDQRSALEEDLERTKKEHRLSMGDALDLSASLDAVLLSGDFDEIRAVICGLIDKIVIDGDDVSIHWNFE